MVHLTERREVRRREPREGKGAPIAVYELLEGAPGRYGGVVG